MESFHWFQRLVFRPGALKQRLRRATHTVDHADFIDRLPDYAQIIPNASMARSIYAQVIACQTGPGRLNLLGECIRTRWDTYGAGRPRQDAYVITTLTCSWTPADSLTTPIPSRLLVVQRSWAGFTENFVWMRNTNDAVCSAVPSPNRTAIRPSLPIFWRSVASAYIPR
jgi:hypothetical protein